ncbi:hypothetical protein NKJ26_30210 [Mesorhizobium sp. M0152]|uniref:hypothetical protein n=1 Tax=Mesorhizobium sp. M0152 TaxID=2956898 RepID=UPI00333D05A4
MSVFEKLRWRTVLSTKAKALSMGKGFGDEVRACGHLISLCPKFRWKRQNCPAKSKALSPYIL